MSLPFWIQMTWIWEGWNKASCPQRSEPNTPEGKACRAAVDGGALFKSGQDGWIMNASFCVPQIKSAQEVLMLMRLNVFIFNVSITKAEEAVTAVWKHIIAVWEPRARVWRLPSSIVVHVSESSHLDERFGPDSGAHGQDNVGSSLQEANMTLQLPALHQRARLQEGGQTLS